MRQLEQFLPAANSDAISQELLPGTTGSSKPVLLHGDLTDENIMGVISKSAVTIRNANRTDLTAHLEAIGCGKYVPLLVEQEELTLESLALLTEDHLKQLGLPLGPRLAILGAMSRIAKELDSDEDDDGAAVTSDEEWETSSSSSSEDEEEPSLSTEARLAKFMGPQQWTPRAVIDFADSKTGDPLYDLVAVFFSALVRRACLAPCCYCRVHSHSLCDFAYSTAIVSCGKRRSRLHTGRTISVRILRPQLLPPHLGSRCVNGFSSWSCCTPAGPSRPCFTSIRTRTPAALGKSWRTSSLETSLSSWSSKEQQERGER